MGIISRIVDAFTRRDSRSVEDRIREERLADQRTQFFNALNRDAQARTAADGRPRQYFHTAQETRDGETFYRDQEGQLWTREEILERGWVPVRGETLPPSAEVVSAQGQTAQEGRLWLGAQPIDGELFDQLMTATTPEEVTAAYLAHAERVEAQVNREAGHPDPETALTDEQADAQAQADLHAAGHWRADELSPEARAIVDAGGADPSTVTAYEPFDAVDDQAAENSRQASDERVAEYNRTHTHNVVDGDGRTRASFQWDDERLAWLDGEGREVWDNPDASEEQLANRAAFLDGYDPADTYNGLQRSLAQLPEVRAVMEGTSITDPIEAYQIVDAEEAFEEQMEQGAVESAAKDLGMTVDDYLDQPASYVDSVERAEELAHAEDKIRTEEGIGDLRDDYAKQQALSRLAADDVDQWIEPIPGQEPVRAEATDPAAMTPAELRDWLSGDPEAAAKASAAAQARADADVDAAELEILRADRATDTARAEALGMTVDDYWAQPDSYVDEIDQAETMAYREQALRTEAEGVIRAQGFEPEATKVDGDNVTVTYRDGEGQVDYLNPGRSWMPEAGPGGAWVPDERVLEQARQEAAARGQTFEEYRAHMEDVGGETWFSPEEVARIDAKVAAKAQADEADGIAPRDPAEMTDEELEAWIQDGRDADEAAAQMVDSDARVSYPLEARELIDRPVNARDDYQPAEDALLDTARAEAAQERLADEGERAADEAADAREYSEAEQERLAEGRAAGDYSVIYGEFGGENHTPAGMHVDPMTGKDYAPGGRQVEGPEPDAAGRVAAAKARVEANLRRAEDPDVAYERRQAELRQEAFEQGVADAEEVDRQNGDTADDEDRPLSYEELREDLDHSEAVDLHDPAADEAKVRQFYADKRGELDREFGRGDDRAASTDEVVADLADGVVEVEADAPKADGRGSSHEASARASAPDPFVELDRANAAAAKLDQQQVATAQPAPEQVGTVNDAGAQAHYYSPAGQASSASQGNSAVSGQTA